MAKRRRRIKIKNSSLFAFVILNLLIGASTANHHHSQDFTGASSQPNQQQQHQYVSSNSLTSTAHLCAILPAHLSRHLKLCKLISGSPNADEAVALGTSKGLAECRNQFRSERWNCTHAHGDHHMLTGELAQSVGNRESGFVHAIAAAGIVHSIATACSVGNLTDCACDKSRIGSYWHMDEKWKWGGCSNNIRHGMLFAKHLVELLDAVHQSSRLIQNSHHHQHQHQQQLHHQHPSHGGQVQHRLRRRSLSSRHREPNQLRGRMGPNGELTPQASDSQQQPFSFCQKNHNISQAAHYKLIRSLLSAHSLERHQEFRLAMNMHNNKVGRMAVAKNMEFRCRCHGLSGSCSLKTCWLSLPNFQIIGAYLKRKYDASVHLPSAVDVNKLIPMMNRDEISAILSDNQLTSTTNSLGQEQQQQQVVVRPEPSEPSVMLQPEYAALVSSSSDQAESHPARSSSSESASAPSRPPPLSGHFILNAPSSSSSSSSSSPPVDQTNNLSVPINAPASSSSSSSQYSYYERHKQHQQADGSSHIDNPKPMASLSKTNQTSTGETNDQNNSPEIPVNIAPLSQQQYQALLRDMRLCNTTGAAIVSPAMATGSYLTTRDLQQAQTQPSSPSKRQIFKKLHNNSNGGGGGNLQASGHLVKSANQHLSQILQHSNKDELIYLHKSPNYCEADLRHGFSGIQSRVCSDNPQAPNNCDRLCCGRGYTTRIYQHSYRCECKFQYCCSIHCNVCEDETKLLVCK